MKASVLLHILRQFLKKIAEVQAFIILTVLYFIFLPIFALLLKIFKVKIYNNRSMWRLWEFKSETVNDLKKQF